MTLPDLLEQAARLMPERFSFHDNDGDGYFEAKYKGREYYAYWLSGPCGDWEDDLKPPVLEYACREELEARGWHAAYIPTIDGQRLAVTIYRNGSGETLGTSWASTPAEALLSALIQAVKGERV